MFYVNRIEPFNMTDVRQQTPQAEQSSLFNSFDNDQVQATVYSIRQFILHMLFTIVGTVSGVRSYLMSHLE